ncbi:ABC transporter permease [Bartonella sp. HY761]|uniref:ABC transporter permease n=1 Tax=Bartonella sp. HY761 TaxID=2979330 RepID=UPI00220CEA91|nr:ABC transporter permease subunit [Bartonella sp. HY761]UXN05472.1 ABC transporter permease subunit [Bartonella sp. HY761]
MMKQSFIARILLIVFALLMALPFLAIIINAFAVDWSNSFLPRGFTLATIVDVLTDTRFQMAFLRSVFVAICAIALAVLLIVPAILVGHIYWPSLDKWMARLIVLPYAIPSVVLVVGYLKIFSVPPLQINGTIWILIFAYVPICFPMLYIALKNSLNGMAIDDLLDAGRLIGAKDETILMRVVIPLLTPALLLAILLNFSILIGEFVYANLLVGGQFETLQIYIYAHRNETGRFASTIVFIYLIFLLVMTILTLALNARLAKSQN